MGFDFGSLNRKLFVEAGDAFAAFGCQATLDRHDTANPVIMVKKGDSTAIIPLAKNQIRVNGKVLNFNGIAVLAEKREKAYLPEEAVTMTAAELK